MIYNFNLVDYKNKVLDDPAVLLKRPVASTTGGGNSLRENARRFVPSFELETAINTSMAVGLPLLITGEPGTGKTQAAYYTAYKLGIEPVLHFQVKSDSSAADLLYHFDAVRYFHDANLHYLKQSDQKDFDKKAYIEKREMWEAFDSKMPRVLLIDEIDKAPRDFPNDLLHELDQMEFQISETREIINVDPQKRPIVFITSNSERLLPEPFLRRCAYHNIHFDEDLLRKAVSSQMADYTEFSREFTELAIQRFLALRLKPLKKLPSTGEFLVWLRVLAATGNTTPEILRDNSKTLPYLGFLVKDEQDMRDVLNNL